MTDLYEELSAKRKQEVAEGKFPEWSTTGSYQMFKDKYEYMADGLKEQLKRISKTLSAFAVPFIPESHPLYKTITKNHGNNWEDCFFSIMWNNDFQLSTPALANTGTDRGMSVSCSGQYVGDSISDFYLASYEAAMLSKMAFGTSAYLGDVRPRGSKISKGGVAEGTTHPKVLLQETARKVSQGGQRRGSIALYLEPTHPDFDEWADDLQKNPQGQNIGWIYNSEEIASLWDDIGNEEDSESHRRFSKILKTRMNRGKGYLWKVDTVNRLSPPWYKEAGLKNRASNLC